MTLVYKSIDDKAISQTDRDLIFCYDDMDFAPHFWKLLALRSVDCLVTVQPKVEWFRYENNSAGRKRLAADYYDRVLGRRVSAAPSEKDNGLAGIRTRV